MILVPLLYTSLGASSIINERKILSSMLTCSASRVYLLRVRRSWVDTDEEGLRRLHSNSSNLIFPLSFSVNLSRSVLSLSRLLFDDVWPQRESSLPSIPPFQA